jgi:hypothetical protein
MYAREMEEQEAVDFLEGVLEDIGQRRGSLSQERGAEALVE